MKLPHTVRPFAFEILTHVLLDKSFQSESGSVVPTGRMLVMRLRFWVFEIVPRFGGI